jgi:hypothetical protein
MNVKTLKLAAAILLAVVSATQRVRFGADSHPCHSFVISTGDQSLPGSNVVIHCDVCRSGPEISLVHSASRADDESHDSAQGE